MRCAGMNRTRRAGRRGATGLVTPVAVSASKEHAGQRTPGPDVQRLLRRYWGTAEQPQIVEATAEIAQEAVRAAQRARPGQHLKAACPAQSPLQVLVIALDALLCGLPGLVRGVRQGRGQRRRVGRRAVGVTTTSTAPIASQTPPRPVGSCRNSMIGFAGVRPSRRAIPPRWAEAAHPRAGRPADRDHRKSVRPDLLYICFTNGWQKTTLPVTRLSNGDRDVRAIARQ